MICVKRFLCIFHQVKLASSSCSLHLLAIHACAISRCVVHMCKYVDILHCDISIYIHIFATCKHVKAQHMQKTQQNYGLGGKNMQRKPQNMEKTQHKYSFGSKHMLQFIL